MAILTLHTMLLDETLDGARIIDMGSAISCECFVLPRDKVAEVGKHYPRLQQYGLYILLGGNHNKKIAYIGQTFDFTHRVIDHKQKKDFWDIALVFVSKSNEIYSSEAQYLEYLGWKAAKEADNYIIENTKEISKPRLPLDKQNDMERFFKDIVFITRFYGCEVFDKPERNIVPPPPKPDRTKPVKPAPRKPFDFSMVGLKPGDKIVFDPIGFEVKVADKNKVEYEGKLWSLTGLCKEYLPENMRNSSGAYQGPKYFSYNGKTLWEIRLENEKI